jgi:hypothetical protein
MLRYLSSTHYGGSFELIKWFRTSKHKKGGGKTRLILLLSLFCAQGPRAIRISRRHTEQRKTQMCVILCFG